MFSLIRNFIDTFRPVHTGEEGQDTFEYILVLGVLVVAVITFALAAPSLMTTVVNETKAAVSGLFDIVVV